MVFTIPLVSENAQSFTYTGGIGYGSSRLSSIAVRPQIDASLMLKQGIHPKIVSERLGHSSIGVTLDTYSHVIPGLQEAAALRFEEGL